MRSITLPSALLALTLTYAASPASVHACENAVLVELSQVMRRLDHAESELHGGRTREALADARWILAVTSGRAWGYELDLS
ncbi:MAG: hypothetical protein J0L92_37025, partial [Deltaproteobacteria bacterium]|nr:hypothetical protein [Deltaproteobacteria bacterium]